MSRYNEIQEELRKNPRTWLVTGAAGFIGSNLLEKLLHLDQKVVGLDSFVTGHRRNLDEVRTLVAPAQWARFRFIEGDICRPADCQAACAGVDYVLHQAALGSVPRSLENPQLSHAANVNGFLNMLLAARDARVQRFVFASSSSVYGDNPGLPKVESQIGRPLSPYAATKLMDEIYADVFGRCYGLEAVGLRYFNVFGPRQDPDGAYAAVVPKWFGAALDGRDVVINGDGETSRDFCYISNVIQANLLAATSEHPEAINQTYNIAVGGRTSLNELHGLIYAALCTRLPDLPMRPVRYREFRAGDVRHSLASIDKAKALLGYQPSHTVVQGLRETSQWYISRLRKN